MFSHLVPLARASLFFISINAVASGNMKVSRKHWNETPRFDSSKHRYRKSLMREVRNHLGGWFCIFCKNTNLHGFRYINVNGSSIIESILWLMVCTSSVVFCAILMLRSWTNYSNNPIVTSIYTSNPIWNIPFPGVTICNNNKVYGPHADRIAKYLYANGFTAEESDKFFSSLTKLIRPGKISMDNVTAKQFLDNLDMTVGELMEQLMQPCSALLLRCVWIGEIYDCGKIFKTVKSGEGFCCAFNSHYDLNVAHMSNDTLFNDTSDDLPGVHKILMVPGSGRDVGLAVALNIEPDTYKATSRPYLGGSVMIHDPIDFPDIGAHVTPVLPGHVLGISVTGTSIKSMDSLRNIAVEKRSCYFFDEIPGEIRYSFQSCISECTDSNTQLLCGCLPFYNPQAGKDRTCYLPDINCLLNIQKSTKNYAKLATCKKCLPQCNDIIYHITQEDVKMNLEYNSDLMQGFDINKVSFVYVFFGDISYVEYRKENIISWDSLMASFGGIFGLCLGGSVMSVIEMVYLLARQLFRRQSCKSQEQSRTKLPPASELFLSIPVKGEILQRRLKPRDRQGSNDKHVFVTWYQPPLHHRQTMNHDDMYHVKRKF